jgi:hypothetical protein
MSNPRSTVLSPDAIRFRKLLIDTLGRDRFDYLSADLFVGECPVCGEPIGVQFAGYAPRATLRCHGGCREEELAETLGLVVRP